MNKNWFVALSRSAFLVLAACAVISVIGGCSEDDDDVPPLISSGVDGAPTPAPTGVAPTLTPDTGATTTPRDTPDFPVITPPPVEPDLPDAPEGALQLTQLFSGYQLDFYNLRVRGVIEKVDVQVLNLTCGTDITSLMDQDALAQLENVLLGRGNSYEDTGTFGIYNTLDTDLNSPVGQPTFRFTIPIEPVEAASDGRILVKAVREVIVGFDDEGEPETEDQLTGDDVVYIVTISDTHGQLVRIEDFIFDAGEERVGYGCGAFVTSSP